VDGDREQRKQELVEELRERLRYFASITSVGLPKRVSKPIEKNVPSLREGTETLEVIREDLGDCTRCKLHQGCRNLVYGVGNADADLMFVGEGPGYEEDQKGIPFVGPAGQLLTKIIEAIDLTRDQVYITNVVKCRPPSNRDPEPEEIETCRPFLERQVSAIRPRVICTLGRVATQAMLSTEKPLGRLRGQQFSFGDAVLVPTYHPAFLLRDPSKKRDTWEDMKLIRALLDERR